jgi:Lipoprotein confined to pathogenic Mycobacterium
VGADGQRRVRVVLVLVALLLGLCACGTDKEQPDMTSSDAPAMESVVADYSAMRTEMFRALDAELGKRPWDLSPNNATMVRSGCRQGEPTDGERATLPSYYFPGTYDTRDWKKAAEVVWKVGREHGFTRTGTTVDMSDDLEVYGQDDHGGRYVFGLAANTVLGITTGCHRWRSAPTADAPKTEIPDYDTH